ncbi:ABC transporter permease [Tunturiibacter gelidoferens]|jgi:putative ABC transport system permease protein|uniref:ABC transport system permease protein n=1 Tax=Tunturiibacter gelidiferens TaxID=3069689 RepID=A0A9X0U274_9BACT|nr:ABC transporter permease [Edaphobacter lichenicola]MBB5327099.1 putative ABC transport system permease protein [Edaphobacter lichenicola]
MATTNLPKPSSFDRTLASARSTMMFSEVARLAVDSFRASKTRFLLTMLGMVIGSASIILVATLGSTGKQYALDQLTSIGPNKIELQYGGGNISGPDNTSTPDYMTLDDMRAVLDQVPGIVASSPMLEYHDNVSLGGGITKQTTLLGVSPQYRVVRNLVVVSGRFFDDQDELAHEKVAVIVKPFAEELYGTDKAAVGKTISIKGIPFVVIGVFKEAFDTYGQSEISDHTMLVPYPVVRYFTGTNTLKEIFFTMRSASMVVPASERILEIVRSRHYAGSVYTAATLTDILSSMAKIADMLTIVLTLGAGITMIVSGVGIMNSMLANVQSRLKEIGIRKALGATSREIRMQFLTESVFLSLSGGVIGTIIGLALPLTLGLLTPFSIPVNPWSPVFALGSSVLVGVLFGTLPANRAARLDPVQTLKYE